MNANILHFTTGLSALEAVRILATRLGYDDVDFEPADVGYTVRLTSGGKEPITVSGKNPDIIVKKLVDKLGI
jgi:hypothetical protein